MGTITLPTTGIQTQKPIVMSAIDDHLLPLKHNLCYYITKPQVREEPVLTPNRDNPNAPDHLGTHFYGTVLRDEGEYRMWYYGIGLGDKPGPLREGPICYARSDDGITWEKPVLGQLEVNGSRDNNAVGLPDDRTEGVEILKEDEDPDPARRYKMVYETFPRNVRFPSIRTATSRDGTTWVAGPVGPAVAAAGIEQSSFYRFNGLYFVNGQMWPRGEGGRKRGRQGHVLVSPDFDHWLDECAESFALPEPADGGNDKPYDQVHLGVGAVSLESMLVGLYCIWHARPKEGDWFGKGTTSGDFGLVVSNDGFHFREPVKGHVFMSGEDSPVTPVPGKQYPTILAQAHGIVTVENETRIYHGRWRNAPDGKDYYAEVALATIPRDRWGALGLFPDETAGSLWSAPFVLPEDGCSVAVNADHADCMRFELGTERFVPIGGFCGADAGRTRERSGFDAAVSWPKSSLARLAGETVRLRVELTRKQDTEPRLYAVWITP